MKMSEIRSMSDAQLVDLLAETSKQLFKLKVQAVAEKLEAPSETRKLRKDIARVKTLQRERVLKAGK